jgi:hypothetical protein
MGVPPIRRVHVEFLRPGPSHNQLLSPYTQYLAVCNDAGAAIVTVPYEQRVFERRLKELRYETGDHSDRRDMLQEIGRDMGRILESVPGFTGALMNEGGDTDTLVHVRLTLSADELALLPFELAVVPVGSSSSPLSIQSRPPVSLTRHIRTVSSRGLAWPERPRILFVSSNPQDVPFEEHRAALADAIQRFQYPGRDEASTSNDGRREQYGDLLTILTNPTLVELQTECASAAYTHIHILTHGDLDEQTSDTYGVVLRDAYGGSDVVSGERFVSAIARLGYRPAVVTVASCDSGNVGSVVAPGASFAHAVHQSGVPLVVAAQFPLSKDGSIPLTSRLYHGLLAGDHPLAVLRHARAELHARYDSNWHDWASVVAYEALPPALDEQLDLLTYSQARRRLNAALERLDQAVTSGDPASVAASHHATEDAMASLPADGAFAVECTGLLASAYKRLAQAAFMSAGHGPFAHPCDLLDRAGHEYARAMKGLLVNDARTAQRKATLHWLLVQLLSMRVVLESGEWDSHRGEWEAGRLAAEQYRDHPDVEERAWSHGSLAELWLLRLADSTLSADERRRAADEAARHAQELDRLYPGDDAFPVKSTRRQFERYVEWWGSESFARDLKERDRTRSPAWSGPGQVIDVARRLAQVLRRRAAQPAPAAGPAAGTSAPPSPSPLPDQPATPRRDAPFLTLEALPAGHGDCLWIEYGDATATHRVLVDCGTVATAEPLLARVDAVPADERFIELFVMSHIDSDHIGGAIRLFRAVKQGLTFGDVWFNGWRHVSGQLGARQGEMFSTALQEFGLPWNAWQDGAAVVATADTLPRHLLPGGMTLTLLSPTQAELDKLKPVWTKELKRYGLEPGGKVDYSRFLRGTPSTIADADALQDIDGLADTPFAGDGGIPNGTSIALLAEYAGASVLLAADAHAPVLTHSIRLLLRERGQERLKVDLFKVSHHGSQNNVSTELISLLDCPRYLISTNGDHFYHPDRQALARILKYGQGDKTVLFNYNNKCTEVWGHERMADVRRQHRCETVYPPRETPGMRVKVL